MNDTKLRSFVKSLTWRVLAVINGFIFAMIFTGNVSQSLKISIFANVSGLLIYYAHERVWDKIKWQKKF